MLKVEFPLLNDAQKEQIYEIRSFYTPVLSKRNSSFTSFLRFCKYLKNQNDKKYYALFNDESEFLGVIALFEIKNSSSQIALYKNPKLKSVGRILLNEIIKESIILGLKTLFAKVKDKNTKALDFFSKNGFKTAQILDKTRILSKNI